VSYKNIILFFSYTGNCMRVANLLSKEAEADCFGVKSAGFGFFKPWIHKLRVKKGKSVVFLPKGLDLGKYEIVFIGGPVWYGSPAPALQDLIKQLDLSGKKVFLFLVAANNFGIAVDELKDLVKSKGASIKGLMSFFSYDSEEAVLEKIRDHLLVLE
jgi:flavodoxin